LKDTVRKNTEKGISYFCNKTASEISKSGVKEFEVYGGSAVNNEIEIFDGEIESLAFSDTKGIGIRIFNKGRVGYAYTSNLEDSAIKDCVGRSIENSRISTKDIYNYLPSKNDFLYPGNLVDKKSLFSEKFESFNVEEKTKLVKELEKIARKKDKRITGINDLIYNDVRSETVILNSSGFTDSYETTSAFVYLSVISREKSDTSTGDYFGCARDLSYFDIEDIADNAAKRSTWLLGAKKISSRKADLLLDPFVSAQFLQVIAGILTADAVQKGKSLFKGQIGNKIFSVDIKIIDDGTLPDGLASKPFDAEGAPKGRTVVFDKGILQTFLYDTYTARKENKLSTGNAVRASYMSSPQTGISNFYLENGKIPFTRMIDKIDKGLYVTDIIGVHSGINPVSGQISVGAKGLFIEKGSISYPVKEITIATDISSFCGHIAETGNDLKFLPSGGYVGSPSVIVKDITISGA